MGNHRVLVTADRGVADVNLCRLLEQLGVRLIIRVKAGTNVAFEGRWRRLSLIPFRGNERHRSLGALFYCEREAQRVWISKSRAREAKGKRGIWHFVSNHPYEAKAAAAE